MPNVSYYAGFFDGEGSVSITNRGIVHVAVAQKNPFILYEFEKDYGGSVHEKHLKFSQGYHWRLGGKEKLGKFLNDIYPYTIVKKDEIRLALEVLSLIRTDNKGCNPLSKEEFDKRMQYRMELLQKRSPKTKGIRLISEELEYRNAIKAQFDYKCAICGIDLKDKTYFWQIVSGGKLFCRKCNRTRYSFEIKPISSESIIEAIKTSPNLDEAAKKVGLTRSSLFKKRKKLGLEMKRQAKLINN